MRRVPLVLAAAAALTAPAPAAALPPKCPAAQRPCAITGRTLLAGPAPSRVRRPVVVAAAGDGRLAVSESGGERVLVLTADGEPSFARPGDRQSPSELAFAPDGDLYASQRGSIVRLAADGRVVGTITDGLQAAGADDEPPDVRDLAVDGLGRVHGLVGDELLTWDATGAKTAAIPVGSRADGLAASGSRVYVGGNGQIQVLDAGTGATLRTIASLPDGSRTAWITTDDRGRLYVPGEAQLARYASDGTPAGSSAIRHDDAIDAGVAVTDDAVVVADTAADRLDRFSPAGTSLDAFGTERGAGLNDPVSVAAAPDGRLLVADARDHRVVWFGPDGAFGGALRDLGQDDLAPQPRAAVPLPGGGAAILYATGRVEVVDGAGDVVTAWTLQNPLEPGGMALAADGTLWLRDGSAVSHYDTTGALLGSLRLLIGSTTEHANGVAVAGNGDLWLTGEEELLVVEKTGAPVRRKPVDAPEGVALGPKAAAVAQADGVLLTGRNAKSHYTWAPNTADASLGLPYATAYEPSGEVVLVDRAHGELVRIGGEPLPRPTAPAGTPALSFPPQSRRLFLNPNGTVGVRLACGPGAACQGRIRLLRRGTAKGVPAQLGGRRFAMRADYAVTFEVPVNFATRRAVKKRRWTGATAVASLTGGGEARYRVGLKAKRPPKRAKARRR